MTADLDRDVLFKRLRAKPENKMCFDCPARNPTWATVPYGCYLCLSCAGVHRSLGVHITFVRSTTLDSWTPEQLKIMAVGGNGRARHFFKQHGWDELGADKIESKYTSRAAQLYKGMLEKEAAKLTPAAAMAVATGHGKEGSSGFASGELHDFHHVQQGDPGHPSSSNQSDQTPQAKQAGGGDAAGEDKPTAPAPAAARPASVLANKARLGVTKKPGAGKLGLGVKKLDTKVDESLFDQTPAPEPAPAVNLSDPLVVGAGAAATSEASAKNQQGSRFAYDIVTEPASSLQRGKDGHLTLTSTPSDDFFGNKASSGTARSDHRPASAAFPGKPAAAAALSASSVAQQKFGSAKAISSRDFENDGKENEADRQGRLSKFQGAAAISSADFFGNSQGSGSTGLGGRRMGPSGDHDNASLVVVSQLSLRAQQDLRQMAGSVTQAAGSMTKKLSGMASKLMSDLGRGH